MIIKSMRVMNFRSINDAILSFNKLTILVGANGSGKSSFLDALHYFLDGQKHMTEEDFYNKNTDREILITLTFTNLSSEEKKEFSKYCRKDELSVDYVIKYDKNNDKMKYSYHSNSLQNNDFKKFRECTNATDAKTEYEKLKSTYQTLPKYNKWNTAVTNINEWEEDNKDKCTWIRDDGKFFEYHEGDDWRINKYIKSLHIPAVKEALPEAIDKRQSILSQVLDIVVREQLDNNEKIQELQKDIKSKYQKILKDELDTTVSELSDALTNMLQRYVSNGGIKILQSLPKNFQLDLPSASANIIEDEYTAPVDKTGHGLQRVFIMTMFEYLLKIKSEKDNVGKINSNTLMFIVEEPELYQHPDRQRYFAKMFNDLSEQSDVQIIYSTHSPQFVGFDKFSQIRILRKKRNEKNDPKITTLSSVSIDKLVEKLNDYQSKEYTKDNLTPLLSSLQSPWINEGFFAKCIVLVEGYSDRAAILATSEVLDQSLEKNGYAVIPYFGIDHLSKVAIIFKELKIPIYSIWDNDVSKDKDERKRNAVIDRNKKLLKLFDAKSIVNYPIVIEEKYAVLEDNLETTLEKDIGSDSYNNGLEICRVEYNLKISDVKKNPVVIRTMLEDLPKSGKNLPKTLEKIIVKIHELGN